MLTVARRLQPPVMTTRTRRSILKDFSIEARRAATGRQAHAISLWEEGLGHDAVGARIGIRGDSAAELVQRVLARMRRKEESRLLQARADYPPLSDAQRALLNPRQVQLYALASQGKSTSEIARALGMPVSAARAALHRMRMCPSGKGA